MAKVHAPLFLGIERALADVFEGGYLADKVIQRKFQENRKWGSHDRRLFAEITYGCVRWWRRLQIAAGSADSAAAIVSWCMLNNIELHPNVSGPQLDLGEVRRRWEDAGLTRAERESAPDWLDQLIAPQLGESEWTALLQILNQTAPVYLRANRLKTTPEKLIVDLAAEKIEASAAGADGVILSKRANVHQTESFKRGQFEVQDLNSQEVARCLNPQPGERVIDACAGAGGKSLHLAALMKNKGRIVAMDVVEKKLEELRRRASRAGVSCIETRLIEGTKTVKRLAESADRVLLDVPCTGLGVWRRNPDAKWRISPESMARVRELQKEILRIYPRMTKVGGTLVYSTCSILPEENQIRLHEWLAQTETRWEIERETTLLPRAGGPDGFYLARLKRLS